MKHGTTSLEFELSFRFTADGEPDAPTISFGGRELPKQLVNRLLLALTRRQQEELVSEAWDNAEDEADDAACDEARAPGAA
jgi:hypothetical protein